jgi:hypothetical protein
MLKLPNYSIEDQAINNSRINKYYSEQILEELTIITTGLQYIRHAFSCLIDEI